MKIEVIGNCCASCHATFNIIKKTAAEIDTNIEVVHIENIAEILRRGVIQMPTVVIDGITISSGVHYTHEQARQLILNHLS